MFKLDKTQLAEVKNLEGTLNDAAGNLADLLDQVNEQVEDSVRLYNAAADALETKLQELSGAMQEEFEEKSDDWQESDKGQATTEWIEALSSYVENEVNRPEFDEAFKLTFTERDDFAEIPPEPEEE